MFSDRNGTKTIPFGVACAHTWISLYKGGLALSRAKKPLTTACLKKKKATTTAAENLLLVTTTCYFVT